MTPLLLSLDVALSPDAVRLVTAGLALAVYVLMCLLIVRRERIKRSRTTRLSAAPSNAAASWRIVFASQTGSAEEFARLTADTFHLAGIGVQLNSLSELDADTLAQTQRALFIVSTYGEGNPPDNAALFAQRLMNRTLPLAHLHYGLLALGDRSYANFCGFGDELDGWLTAQGAQSLFPRIEADRCNAQAIDAWWSQLSHLAGTDDAPDWQGPAFTPWRLSERRHLNPGSQGNGVFHLEFEPSEGAALPIWEAGDLAQIQLPAASEHPREYSIASLPSDGRIHLLVRQHRQPDGEYGAVSGWLTQRLPVGDAVQLRLRRHDRFRIGTNAERPLILIGNGSGIAGLRGHLKARAANGAGPNWLIFGERNGAIDYHYREELEIWQRDGILEKLDAVFSRDQPERRYVQQRLLEVGAEVREWINRGAAIYVCGSLRGMAGGVDEALTTLLEQSALDELSLSGRYRRDVY